MNITVLYSCHGCDISKRLVSVPARQGQDVKQWINATMELIGKDHRKASPYCRSELADLMIPISGADKVGGVSKQ